MILKSYELEKKNITKYNIYLFYGQNEGLKKQVIEEKFCNNFDGELIKVEEAEIIKSQIEFISSLMNRSFFEKEKLLSIKQENAINYSHSEQLTVFIEDVLKTAKISD